MPTFPTYHGPPLPEVLNPLNPRHYWLLFTWIYFQPSGLKHYLYRADPELYKEKGLSALRRALRLPAYRNLYLMLPVITALLSLSIAWIASAAQGTTLNWSGLAVVVVGGVIGAVAFGMAFGAVSGVVDGVAFGVVFGVVDGVAVGVLSSVVFGVLSSVVVGMMVGMMGGIAVGMVFGLEGIVLGGGAFGIGLGVVFGVLAGAAFGLVVGVVGDMVGSVVGGVAGGTSGSRLVFHFFEWPLAWWLARSPGDPFVRIERHPAIWDELAVWPLPGAEHLLHACLLADLERGLILTARIAANPFQCWAAQHALSDFVTDQDEWLATLYQMAHSPTLGEYLVIPTRDFQFERYPSIRLVLLGELGQKFVVVSSTAGETYERLIWQLTRRLRQMDATPLSEFSAMLYELIRDETLLETQDIQEIKLAERFASAYEGVRQFKHGEEVFNSFAAIAFFIRFRTIGAITAAYQQLNWLEQLNKPPLRPSVVESIKALGDVSREAATFRRATSIRLKSAALNRAAGALNELAGYIEKEVKPPERVLLKRVIQLWQSIVAVEQGKLGEAALREMAPSARRAAGTVVERTSAVWQRPLTAFDNPYVAGNPVAPPLFVGRADIFNRIGEVWSAKRVPDSIILYGHRRMGKSSILRNLNQAAPPESVVVYADMAGETSFVESTPDLLLGLADKICTALQSLASSKGITRPDPAAYNSLSSAAREFNRFTEQTRAALNGQALILALDEFEAVERAVEAGKIGKEIYQFLRAKTQEPWITLVLGGLHTLDEMSRDYQQPFYGSYENIRVSYLAHADAWRLITNPTEDFALNYEPEAAELIIAETGGQPYLVQQVCRDALDHLNHELIDERRERDAIISLADVEAVLGLDFFQRGTVYFDGVWNQASDSDHRTLLRAMARRPEPWSLPELESATQLSPDALSAALRWAERHDILRASKESLIWDFHVPLMRRWVSERRDA